MKMLKDPIIAAAALSLILGLTACKKEIKADSNSQDNETYEESTTGKVHYSLNKDGRKWRVANEETQDQMMIKQYVLEDEQPENVTELFTVTEMSDINITPPEYFSQFITELTKRYTNSKVESKIINQKTNSLLGEWWIDGKSPDNTQHEWIRIIKKGNDIAVLRYSTMQNDKMEQNRKVWESILNEAKYQ